MQVVETSKSHMHEKNSINNPPKCFKPSILNFKKNLDLKASQLLPEIFVRKLSSVIGAIQLKLDVKTVTLYDDGLFSNHIF